MNDFEFQLYLLNQVWKASNGGESLDLFINNSFYSFRSSSFFDSHPATTINFEVPEESFIKVTIFNTLGKQIKVLINNYFSGGVYQKTLDGKDSNGADVSAGLYFYKLESKKYSITKKMLLLK